MKKLKRKIEDKTEIPRKKQVLTDKKKRPLERDSKPIKQYGVKNGDTLDVKPVGKKPMTIYVKTPSGKKVTIKKVKASDKVSKIKKAVEKETNIPAKKQDLRDKHNKPRASMRDSKPIGTYGVKDQDTLTMKKSPIMTVYVKTPKGKQDHDQECEAGRLCGEDQEGR